MSDGTRDPRGEDLDAVRRRLAESTAPRPFTVAVVPNRDEVLVVPRGELDVSSVGGVARTVEELRAAGFDQIVVDLRDVEFIDSQGLQLLLQLRADAEEARERLTLVPPRPAARRIFDLTGTRDLFAWRGVGWARP